MTRHLAVAALALALFLGGCGSGGTDVTTGSIALSLSPTSASIQQGGSTQVSGTITRSSFTGDVSITVSGAPAGVTGTVTLAPTNGSNTAQVTLAAALTTPVGVYPLVVAAHGSGIDSATAQFTLTVTAATPAGSFTIAAGAPSVTAVQGSPASTTITATRLNGLASTISYTVSGPANAALPAGLSATIALGSADHNTLNVTTTATLAAGTYPLVVHATSPGLAEQTVTVNVIVTALPPSNVVRLDFNVCAATERPIWFAMQDGSGAFVPVTGAGNVYTFTITSPKAAYAYVTQFNATAFNTQVQYFAQSESGTLAIPCTNVVPAGKTYNGTVAGIPFGTSSSITVATNSLSFRSTPGAFQLANVPSGVFDLIAFRSDYSTTSAALSRAIIRRDLNLADGATLPAIDYAGTEAVDAASATVTVASRLPNETIDLEQRYYTGASCSQAYLYGPGQITGLSGLMLGIPASLQRATDFHSVNVRGLISSPNYSFRTAQVSYHTMMNINVTLPAILNPAVTIISSAANSYRLLQSVVPMPAGIQTMSQQYSDAAGRGMYVTHTAGYLGGAATATIIAPDLGTVAGYLSATWGVSKNSALTLRHGGTGSTGANACTEGATLNTTRIDGTLGQS